MSTNDEQLGLISPTEQLHAYEAIISLRLEAIRTWTRLPDERVDWELERLLRELETAALAVRRLRGDMELPF